MFWCNTCDAYTPRNVDDDDVPYCVRCGEVYQCGECGYEIDVTGECLRPEGHLPVGEEP